MRLAAALRLFPLALLATTPSVSFRASAASRNDNSAISWLRVGAPNIASADIITFAPDGILMVGDSRSSTVFAVDVHDTGATASPADVSLGDIDSKVAALLGATARDISIRDMAVHPRSHNVYLAVTRGRDAAARPAIVRVSARGKLDVVSLNAIPFAQVRLPNPPSATGKVEGDSARIWTISAMSVVNNKLYVAGMSNEEFSSIVRQVAVPFDSVVSSTALRVYHTHHVRYETDSPITAFAPYTFFGRTFLVAAYSCTPIALYNVDSLQAGATVTGRTIAELGGGNVVRDVVPFDYEGKRYVAISNRNRSLQIMNATALPNAPLLDEHTPNPLATVQPGLSSWIGWGLEHGSVAQVGILHLSDLDEHNLIAIQRDVESGSLNLRPLKKPFLYP